MLQALRHGALPADPKDPYGKVGVCGATIDTIMSRNFARMVAAGTAAHTDHGMSMLDLFRDVVNGKIKDYGSKTPSKLEEVALELGIEVEGRELRTSPRTSTVNWNGPISR